MIKENGCKKDEIHRGLGNKLRGKRRCQGDSGKLERLEENQGREYYRDQGRRGCQGTE